MRAQVFFICADQFLSHATGERHAAPADYAEVDLLQTLLKPREAPSMQRLMIDAGPTVAPRLFRLRKAGAHIRASEFSRTPRGLYVLRALAEADQKLRDEALATSESMV